MPQLDLSTFYLPLILLAIASFISEIYEVPVLPNWSLSTATAVKLAAVYIGDVSLGVWVVVLSTTLAESFLRWDHIKESIHSFLLRVVFNVGQLCLSIIAAGLAFSLSGGSFPPYESVQDYIPLILAFVAYETVNTVLVSGIISISDERRFTYVFQLGLKKLILQFFSMGILAILMAILFYGAPEYLILGFLPLALVHYSVRNYLKLRFNSHEAFKKITDLLGKRDFYTGEHSGDVENLVIGLAKKLNLSDQKIENIKMGAAIHDIGKIAVPDAILNKPGPLTEEEWSIMKQHPVVGAEIIGELEIYRDVVPIVRHEHEHWDGGGYPDGLSGEEIPVGARVVAVADVYSALTTERAYRPSQGKPLKYAHEEARKIMQEGMAGKVLDPELVNIFFEKVLPEGRES